MGWKIIEQGFSRRIILPKGNDGLTMRIKYVAIYCIDGTGQYRLFLKNNSVTDQ